MAGLSFDTNSDHIYGHDMAIPGMAIMAKTKKMAIMANLKWPYYDHLYGHYWYQNEAQPKCRSTAKTALKNISLVKSYGQNKIRYQIIVISFVFLPSYDLKMAIPEEALPMGPQS